MFSTVSKMKKADEKGFTLIELLIVVAIIGILAAIAIPGYLGMQERGRKGAVTRVAESSAPELQAWMNSAKKANTVQGALREVDTNGSGAVDAADDDNNTLATNGIVVDWLAAHGGPPAAVHAVSPWDATKDLWVDGGVKADLAGCVGGPHAGQISVCYTPNQNAGVQQMFIVAFSNDAVPAVIYKKAVSAD